MAQIHEMAVARLRQIHRQRAEILTAFIAKYKCEPDDIIQVVQQIDPNTEIFYLTKKQPGALQQVDEFGNYIDDSLAH